MNHSSERSHSSICDRRASAGGNCSCVMKRVVRILPWLLGNWKGLGKPHGIPQHKLYKKHLIQALLSFTIYSLHPFKSQTSTTLHFPLHHNKRIHITSNPESSCFWQVLGHTLNQPDCFCFSPKTKEKVSESISKSHPMWSSFPFKFGTMIGALIRIRLRKGQDKFAGFIAGQRSSWMPASMEVGGGQVGILQQCRVIQIHQIKK